MEEYIYELSKYVILLCMVLYTYESFAVLRLKDEKSRKGIYTRQNILLFFTQFFCFLPLCLKSGDIEYLFYYAFVQIFLFSCISFTRMLYERVNRLLLNNMCMLLGVGFVILARISLQKAIRQFVIVVISFLICLLVPYLIEKIKFWKKIAWIYALAGLLGLGTVLILGEVTHGSKITFTLGDVTFQPSEFVKILFIFLLAALLCEKSRFWRVGLAAVLAGAHVLVLVFSKDLGSALIFFAAFVFVVFLASGSYWYLAAGLAGAGGACVLAYQLFDHVRVRVLAWQDPWAYIDSKGYQITQSLFAIGSGNWFGMGLFSGTPADIPYVDADFIFSAVCEELGVLFGICVILVSLSSFVMIMNIAVREANGFFKLVTAGIGILYIFQIFLTVGGGTKFIPLTGVTLPFVSYGGSSVLTTMLMFYVVQGIVNAKGRLVIKNASLHKKIPFAAVTYFFLLLFAGMIAYLCYFTATSEQDMINNSYNSRQEILLSENYRGSIFSADGQVLAETVFEADGTETRNYPFEELFSHVVGFSTQGKTGVESQANYYLINSNISLAEKIANSTAGKKNPGNNVYTTLDVELQEIASTYLGTYNGAIIVTEPSTGRILTMLSKPDFDPNEIVEIWDDLLVDKESSVLLNRATQGLYPPGSTFKMLTALEYLRQNPDAYSEYSYHCNSQFTSEDYTIHCAKNTSHGSVSFIRSFAKSCNSSFANIGLQLNKSSFAKTLEDFLFNESLPVAFQYARSSITMDESLDTNAMMQTSIGQWKTQITPLHLNMITAAIANGGVMMKPYVVDYVDSASGSRVKTFHSSEYRTVMTVEEAEVMKEMMTEVVLSGTGKRLAGQSYTAAGKTGSAEYSNVKGESHAWFTGFAPVEDPQICVTIIVEGGGSGGDYALPIAKRIFDAYLLQDEAETASGQGKDKQ